MVRVLTLLLMILPGLAQARDDAAHAGGGGWMDRFFGYTAYKAGYYQPAIDLWLPLAESGDPRAQEFIGILHEEAHGVPKDIDKTIAWYERATESGDLAAQLDLGRIYLEGKLVEADVERARDLLKRAADQGDQDALALLKNPTH